MLGSCVERVATALDVVIARDLILVDAAPVLVLPRALHVGIIGAVLDMAATLDHQHLEPALGAFLGGPAAAHPRTADDGVEGGIARGRPHTPPARRSSPSEKSASPTDRKRIVSGKSEAERVDVGGRRITQKKN